MATKNPNHGKYDPDPPKAGYTSVDPQSVDGGYPKPGCGADKVAQDARERFGDGKDKY
jgi:hypothetical protein